jgi:UDP-N-acetylmuramoyl-L-alanyl-D-glutamate--2,6-diaminopimelate ligase
MNLRELLSGLADPAVIAGLPALSVPSVWDDSRRVMSGSLLVLMRGAEHFAGQGLERGAAVLLADSRTARSLSESYPQALLVPVEDPREAFKQILLRFYARPSGQVRVLGVTGTNGKTTVTYLLESILNAAGHSCGVTGTVNCRIGGKVSPAKNTTPGMLDNQMFLHTLSTQNILYSVMEVSSHALAQGRVDMIDFCGAIFTNLTGDHLDYHGTMEEYFTAKSLLFRSLSEDAYAVINNDDPYAIRLCNLTRARVISYALHSAADITAEVREIGLKGTRLLVKAFGRECEVKTTFIGQHNIYNILAAFSAGLAEGFSLDVLCRGINMLAHVPGRLEPVDCGQDFGVYIDYAHTDDGLRNVLQCLKGVAHNRLILVFGCGGDRDRTKRPRMGRVAGEMADYCIITSDNPRNEDPLAIIEEILPGFSRENYEVEPDRQQAIERALAMAGRNDIVLLAGKGHETYQIFKDKTLDFVESSVVSCFLGKRLRQDGKVLC